MNSAEVTAEASAELDTRRWWALATLVMAQLVTILDTSIVTVALPSMQEHLGFSEAGLQWVVTAYTILFGGVLLLGGRLADLQGRRLVFMLGLGIFTAASLVAGLSWDDASMIVARAVQGLGAALLVPAALSILVSTFPAGKERNLALGVWSATSAAGGSLGLILGGVLTQEVSWRWIFFINVPVGVVVLLLSPRMLGDGRGLLAHRRFDFAGAVTITSGLMLLVYATTHAASHGWSSGGTIALLAASAALLAAFVLIESLSPAALLPLRLFRLRTLSGANVAGVFAGVALSAFFSGTLYMQLVLGFSPIRTGLGFLAMTVTIVFAAGVVQSLVIRVGIRPLVSIGFLLVAAGLFWLAQVPVDGQYWSDVFGPFVLLGLGLAPVYVGQQVGAQVGVTPQDEGIAAGLIGTSQQLGAALLVAVATTLYTTGAQNFATDRGVAATGAEALTHGFTIVFYVFSAISVFAAIATGLLIESREREQTEVGLGEVA